MGKADKESRFSKRDFIAVVSGYGVSLESEAEEEVDGALPVLSDTQRNEPPPQIALQEVDNVVRFIEENYAESSSYRGAKFTPEPCFDEIPWHGPSQELVAAKNPKARHIHDVLRDFYYLLQTAEYWASQYSVRIEAARQALFTVYPYFFQEVPPSDYVLSDDQSELEVRREITKRVWPAAERFNGVVDKIAEIVSGSGYRSKIAREKAKLRQRARSATELITGLLDHHESLTVVAVRLSIRQDHGRDFIGDKMQKALRSLIGDRRNDNILSQAVGYFWVLQESFRAGAKQRPPKSNKMLAVEGKISLHYDLVMFFDAIRLREADAIAGHIGACWKVITGAAGRYQRLSGREFTPHFSRDVIKHLSRTRQFPPWAELSGLVEQGSVRAKLLRGYATYMVASALLRKPSKPGGTLIKGNTRRFGKSDLQTGCGRDKPGRGNKVGHSGVKQERKRRPKYVPPEFGRAPGHGEG